MTDQPIYLSVRQAADLLSVSTRTIRRYIKQWHLPAYRIAGQPTIRIKREDIESLLEPIAAEGSDDGIARREEYS
jgi:excisionase family DNA binding protein